MNDFTSLEKLDSRLSYKARNPDGTEMLSFRGLGDGTWLLATNGQETRFVMREVAVKRQLHYWRDHCGTVTIFACCCPKCSPPEMRKLQNEVGRVSHGYWQECFQEAKAAMLADVRKECVGAH